MSAQKQQPVGEGRQLLDGFRSAHSRLVDSQQHQSQGLPELMPYETVPSVESEFMMLLTPTNRVSSGPFQTPDKDDPLVAAYRSKLALNEDQYQYGSFGGRATYPSNGGRPQFASYTAAEGIRKARVAAVDNEPSIEQAVNVNHLLEVNHLLRSQNTSLQQNNHLLRVLLGERERQLQESGQLQLKHELDELRELLHRLQLQKMQNIIQSHTSQSESEEVSISLMEHHMKELREDLNNQSERLRDKEREMEVLRECLRQEKNSNDRLMHRVRDLEEQLAALGGGARNPNHASIVAENFRDGHDPLFPQQQQQTVVKQAHQPSLLLRGKRSYSVSSHQQEQSVLIYPQRRLSREKSKVQLARNDSERVFGHYTKQLGRLTAENDKLLKEIGNLNHLIVELRISLVRLEEQRNAFQKEASSEKLQLEECRRQCRSLREQHAKQVERLKGQLQRMEADVREKAYVLEKRDQSLSYHMKLSEEAHHLRGRVLQMESQLRRLRQNNEHLRQLEHEAGTRVADQPALQELWRQKNNQYVLLQQQLNSLRTLQGLLRK